MGTSNNAPKNGASTVASNAELLEMQRKKRKKRRNRILLIVLAVVLVFVGGIVFLIKYAMGRVQESMNKIQNMAETATVERDSIGSTVEGSSNIESVDVKNVDVLKSLSIKDIIVKEGDSINEGDLIATFTNASINSEISKIQSQIDSIDKQIKKSKEKKASAKIKTSLDGRVKVINVEKGNSVDSVMYDKGNLIVISLDGHLAVDIESESLKKDDKVTVVSSSGSEYEGVCSKNINKTATILISDKDSVVGDKVTVKSSGSKIGEGELYVNSALNITGYVGNVDKINVKVNDKVESGDVLLELTDTETNADFDSLLKQRGKLEEDLNNMLKIYKEGGIKADISGVIETLNDPEEDEDNTTTNNLNMDGDMMDLYRSFTSGRGISTNTSTNKETDEEEEDLDEDKFRLAVISPNSQMRATIEVGENDIFKVKEGQKAEILFDLTEMKIDGVVEKVDTKATTENKTYKVTVVFDKKDDMLSGMSCSVRIIVNSAENALVIPYDALTQKTDGYYVFKSFDNNTQVYGDEVKVEVGVTGYGTKYEAAEIKSGLAEGDVVYYKSKEDPFERMARMQGMMDEEEPTTYKSYDDVEASSSETVTESAAEEKGDN